MVSIKGSLNGIEPAQLYGLSTDNKPLVGVNNVKNVPNGSCFIEMDTSKIYFYDGENNLWKKFTA